MFSRMNAVRLSYDSFSSSTQSSSEAAGRRLRRQGALLRGYKIYTFIDGKEILVRCYEKEGPVFASAETDEIPGTFAVWKFTPGTEKEDYTFTNYAFNTEITAELSVGAPITVSSKTQPVQFRKQPSHSQDVFVIRITNKDLVWTIAKDGDKRPVTLQKADGSQYQDFKIEETVPC